MFRLPDGIQEHLSTIQAPGIPSPIDRLVILLDRLDAGLQIWQSLLGLLDDLVGKGLDTEFLLFHGLLGMA